MVFMVDRKNYRTYDPDRGYELLVIGGGSDGTVRFKLVGPDVNFDFSASSIGEKLRPDEVLHLGENHPIRVVVWRIHHWPDDQKALIREAMQAYIINHGSPLSGVEAFVRFGEKGGVFDV